MELNMSSLIRAMYLNAFALRQNTELQIMATFVHLSIYLLFVINLSPFKFFNVESAVFRRAYVKHTDLKIARQRNLFFSLKKGKRKKE